MSKLNLSNWIFDDIVPGEERFAEVSIIVKYPELHLLVDSIPSERPKVRKFLRDVYVKQLIDTKLFEAYELIETSGGLIGIKTKIEFRLLEKVEALDFVESISLRQIDHGREIKRRAVKRFYCVKMTVAIEIENKVAGMQSIEERFVLVKAKSNLDAYSKIEKHKESYSEPYLNSDGYGSLENRKFR